MHDMVHESAAANRSSPSSRSAFGTPNPIRKALSTSKNELIGRSTAPKSGKATIPASGRTHSSLGCPAIQSTRISLFSPARSMNSRRAVIQPGIFDEVPIDFVNQQVEVLILSRLGEPGLVIVGESDPARIVGTGQYGHSDPAADGLQKPFPVESETTVEAPIEADRAGAEESGHETNRLVSRFLDQNPIAPLETGRIGEKEPHGRPIDRKHILFG